MRILIAPDKFKGSMSANDVGQAIRDGLLSGDPSTECIVVPLADGGEGTTEVLTTASAGTYRTIIARDPLGERVSAQYGLTPERETAFIEMAAASGLNLVPKDRRNPLLTSSFGTGEMIRHALDSGVKNICIGIGGTATNDAGIGAMIALGIRFFDTKGKILEGIGDSLDKIDRLDASDLHPKMGEATFTIFCDVDNPLYGERGAAVVFAPQKGATPEDVQVLDRGLRHYESVLQRYGYSNTNFPGAGAGGGFPVSLSVFGKAVIQPGINFIMEYVKLEDLIKSSDVIITGEGKLDDQTLSGKVVKGVSTLAALHRKPLAVVAGISTLNNSDLTRLGIARLITLADDHTSVETAIANGPELLRKRVRDNYLAITGRQQASGLPDSQ
ncbi:glycerate kinase [Chryseolinea sp. T2]|uniref:glycerate kinase n=1 Tax=Chryseolinea sp. T2 TaxID=3129255 RepID=UPI0030779605